MNKRRRSPLWYTFWTGLKPFSSDCQLKSRVPSAAGDLQTPETECAPRLVHCGRGDQRRPAPPPFNPAACISREIFIYWKQMPDDLEF
ncbi:MAG: hypothetical protein ACM3U2_24385, partial [Deltaproteobacteria bacterium]